MNNLKAILKAGMSILAIVNGGFQLYELCKGKSFFRQSNNNCVAEEANTQEVTTESTEVV